MNGNELQSIKMTDMTYRLMFVTTFEYLPSEIVALSSLPSSMSLAICSPSHLNVNTAVIAPKIA